MSFETITNTTDNRANTLAFTTEQAAEIYSLVQDIKPIHAQGSNIAQQLKQLEFSLRRQLNQRLHASTLVQYHRARRIPRGLRLAIKPMLFRFNQNKEFMERWYSVLNKCSLDLILLLIQELTKVIKEISEEISVLKTDLTERMDSEDWEKALQEINKKLDTYEKELQEGKLRKYKRDTLDYKLNEVYT